jgi:hypothetical protein
MIKDYSNFLVLGPNSHNQLFGVKMDSWFKWWVTAIYTFVSTAIAVFASDALCPFFTNVIEDHKTIHIQYSKFTCLMIVQVFTIYGVIMSVIGMFVALTQVDFMFIRIAADLLQDPGEEGVAGNPHSRVSSWRCGGHRAGIARHSLLLPGA